MKRLLPLISLVGLNCAASAALVVSIDISDPSAAVVTGLPAGSSSTGNLTVNFNGGISFRNFFTSDESITLADPLPISGDWRPAGTSTSYNETVTFVYGDPDVVPGVDLSIYNSGAGAGDLQTFATGERAFFGSSVIDLSSFSALPEVGTTGDVMIGFQSSQGGMIGQWIVIPEPASLSLAALGGGMLLLRRRRG
ncbi:PEP-CTERM sorting domain-containing protein [Haloferula sargassicola]|uniref:PEP-CTERM protein-sorting domain-containing protein n=1 Tax=Haloferula sargassicola TaxID=490096 RepID=A0ABP9UST9_9BACT